MGNQTFQPANAIKQAPACGNGEGNGYIAKAIRHYSRKAGTHNVSECCGKAERVVRALVREKKLPETFVLTQNFREGVFRMDDGAKFAVVERLALSANGRRQPTTYHLLVASAIGKRLAIAGQNESLHGKPAGQWARMARMLIEEAAKNVEHFYGKAGRKG